MMDRNEKLEKYLINCIVLKYKKILYEGIIKHDNFKKDQLSILNIFDYFSEKERLFFESTFIDNKGWYDLFVSRRGYFRIKKKISKKILHILYEEL